tara:strand:+ start:223 stop:459 length:237 start_codon:yes stop_codon:yes gene_type:complete
MFTSSKDKDLNQNSYPQKNVLDPITIWLIRIACIFIIIIFSGILIGIPFVLTLAKGQIDLISLGFKEILRSFLDNYLA